MRKQEDGTWMQVDMLMLKKGDVFKMHEADGSPVETFAGCREFECAGDAYPNEHNIAEVEAEPVTGGIKMTGEAVK